MKKSILAMIIGSLFFLLFGFYMMVQAQSFEIIDIGEGRCPRFSPDSKKIGFFSQGWLCLANSDGSGDIQKIAPVKALDFKWMSDSTLIYWSQDFRTKERIIATVNLKGEVSSLVSGGEQALIEFPPVILPDGTVGFYKSEGGKEPRIFELIKEGTLTPDSALKQLRVQIGFAGPNVMYGDIWLVSVDGIIKERITTNKRFTFPQLSPNGEKILTSKIPGADPYLGQGAYVVDLNGQETFIGDEDIWTPVTDSTGKIHHYSIEASVGLLAEWSPDGSKIVYMYQKTNEEDIVGSDLVIKNADGTGRFQIKTQDEMEMEPVWAPDGNMIACETYKTNKITIFKLNF